MADTSSYSIEERLVVSVWAHERSTTRKTMKAIRKDFCERFNKKAPPKWTILKWEYKLFFTGSILDETRTGRPKREEQCAAIGESLESSPKKSPRKRSSELGIPNTTMLKHMRDDLKLKFFKPVFVNELSDGDLQNRSEACAQFLEVFETLPQCDSENSQGRGEKMANEAKPCPCELGDVMPYSGKGQEVRAGHVDSYLSAAQPGANGEASVRGLIIIQDIYGWKLPNTRFIADWLAGQGYTCIVPDFFLGKEPWSPSHDWSTFQEWLKDKQATNIGTEIDAAMDYLKKECGVQRIGVLGFCWGGLAVHHLLLTNSELQAGVSCYGIIKIEKPRYALKNPVLYIFGENDPLIPLDTVQLLEKRLVAECQVDVQVKVFPGQTHGFVHRKHEDISPADEQHIKEARADLLAWLNKYV
ncbi:carboxymethylenebutenolidase homolog isoform X2 [Lampetra planeri]